MRLHEFRTEEEQLDEILPLIGMAARAALGGAGRLAGKAALGLGKAAAKGVAKGVGKVAKGVAKTAASAVGMGADDEEPQANDPNATVGTQPANTVKPKPMGAADSNAGAAPTPTGAAPTMGADAEIRTGATVDLPTKTPGGKKAFKVTRAQGDDVEIEDPQAKPGEPKRMVYKKDDIAAAMKQ